MASLPDIFSDPPPVAAVGDVPGQVPTNNDSFAAFHKQIELLFREQHRDAQMPAQRETANQIDFGGQTDFERLYHNGKTITIDADNRTHKPVDRSATVPLARPLDRNLITPSAKPPGSPIEGASPKSESHVLGRHPEKRTESQTESEPSANVDQARQRLESTAREHFKNDPAALAKFEKDMKDFELRMASNPHAALEEQRTYDSINKILTGPSSVVSASQRTEIAQDVMDKVAHVTNINQGQTNCCGPSSLEVRLYQRSPSQAARLVEEVSLTGKYHEWPDGHLITVDRNSIAHHVTDVSLGKSQGVEVRSLADQIFQTTAYNIYIDSINQKQHPPGQVRYEIGDPTIFNPSGEKLVDHATHPPTLIPSDGSNKKYADYGYGGLPGLTNDLDNIYERMSGVPDGNFNLNAINSANEREFKATLAELKREGKFPLTMVIDEAEPPFNKVSDGSSDLHFISIRDYDPATGEITYTNGWFGSRVDHCSADVMFKAMHLPEAPNLDEAVSTLKSASDNDTRHKLLMAELLFFEQDRRSNVINKLSKALGQNLWSMLSDAELKELGLSRPNFFDRMWDKVFN